MALKRAEELSRGSMFTLLVRGHLFVRTALAVTPFTGTRFFIVRFELDGQLQTRRGQFQFERNASWFVQAISEKCTNTTTSKNEKSEDETSSSTSSSSSTGTRMKILAASTSAVAPTNALNNNNSNSKSWQYLTCTGETMDDEDENECPWESGEEDERRCFCIACERGGCWRKRRR